MRRSFDLIVLGTGAGGSPPAIKCREAGWRVAVVDAQPYGGTCALRGCDPKKVLVGAAEVVDWRRRVADAGVAGDARIDWPALMRFKRSFTDPVTASREATFEKAGILTLHGPARFVGENRLTIAGQDFDAEHVVIATGAKPRPLHIPGEELVRTSTEFLELEELPPRVAFVGSGYISFEFAHVARRAGARVTVLGSGTTLKRFDQDLVACLVRHTRAIGVDLLTDAVVTRVEREAGGLVVHAAAARGQAVIQTDLVVHGAGRLPDTDGLGAREANIATDENGAVRVNAYLQSTSNPRVYGVGDVALPPGSLPLTPVASHEGHVVAHNLLHGNTRTPDYRAVPTVVFTTPPLATVGLTEAEAKRQGLAVRVKSADTDSWYSNRRVRETAGMFKTIVAEETDRVLGAHVFGPNAEEVINVFALAIRHGVSASELRHTIYAYPTSGSDIPHMV